MESTSPKSDGVMKTTPTTANGKKLVQARLPFKTLGGASPLLASSTIETITAATVAVTANEGRKRKLSTTRTPDDAERAPKLNRIDGDLVVNDLLSTEILDESVEYTMTDRKSTAGDGGDGGVGGVKSEVKSMKSESKENVANNERNDDDDLQLELDESSGGDLDNSIDELDDLMEPKAKKCLNMNSDITKRSKRTNDESLIIIKLPMTKKLKDATKKMKKVDKAKIDPKPIVEPFLSGDTDDDKHSDPEVKKKGSGSDSNRDESNVLDESIVSTNSSIIDDNLSRTPGMPSKQLTRRAESEKKLQEKQRAKEERERERLREKEERESQKKKEREAKEEQRKREKEAKEQKRLAEIEEKEKKRQAEIEEKEKKRQAEIEEKEKKRQAEIETKNEERRKKEEQKEEERRKREEQKEEERKRREEEKRQREEAELNKNRKTAEAFAKFFVPKKIEVRSGEAETITKDDPVQLQQFMSFQIKGDMKVAAVTRRHLSPQERSNLESIMFANAEKTDLYLEQLKAGKCVTQQSGKTWLSIDEEAQNEIDDDIYFLDAIGAETQVIDEKPKKQNYRAKFLRFHENRRPPYHGTWHKKSKMLGPRRPFAQDTTFFDYEIDSDDEWEEEEPGESLHGSDDDEKDQESEDDYVIDNEFFVPHGHLSDEEINKEDELEEESNSETHQAKMKFIQEAFDKEIHKKTEKLKPRVIGLIWQQEDRSQPANCSKATWDLLQANSFMMIGTSITLTPPNTNDDDSSGDDVGGENSTKHMPTRRVKISEHEVPNLIRLINGNQNNINFLIKEFQAFVANTQAKKREFSNVSIRNKIKELAVYALCPEPGPMQNKMCWYVPIDTRKRYDLNDLTLPNTWQYILTPRRTALDVGVAAGVGGCNGCDSDKEKQQTDKQKDRTRRDSNAYAEEIIDLSDDNSCVLSESITSETVKQASSKSANFNIAKFIRVLSEEEKKKQFGSLTLRSSSAEFDSIGLPRSQTPPIPKKKHLKRAAAPAAAAAAIASAESKPVAKKRAKILASAPCGQDISPRLKETLVTQFLNNNTKKRKAFSSDNSDSSGRQSPASTAGTSDGLVKQNNADKSIGDVIILD